METSCDSKVGLKSHQPLCLTAVALNAVMWISKCTLRIEPGMMLKNLQDTTTVGTSLPSYRGNYFHFQILRILKVQISVQQLGQILYADDGFWNTVVIHYLLHRMLNKGKNQFPSIGE